MSDNDADWPFDQPPNAAAMTVRAILDGAPILHVSHDEDDGGWQFLAGQLAETEDGRVIGMQTALRLDPSLRTIADLPRGWIARRSGASDAWVREPHP